MKRTLAILLTASILATSMAPIIRAEELIVPASQSQAFDLVQRSDVPQDRVWSLALEEDKQTIEGIKGNYQDIVIDATAGKFSNRGTDTQINAGTILQIPVQANPAGAELVLEAASNSAKVSVNGQEYGAENSMIRIPLEAMDVSGFVQVVFLEQSYLTQIAVEYTEPEAPYPGQPAPMEALDTEYTFEQADSLQDESGAAAADSKLEGVRGSFENILVDARNGKFNVQADSKRVVINAGTVLYLPVAGDEAGVTLLVSGTQDGSTPSQLLVDGVETTTNVPIELDMSDASQGARYVCVEFKTIAYVNGISLNYASDSDYGTPDVQAKDTVWDLSGDGGIPRPAVQGTKGEYAGLQIDASVGKFTPRAGDTQINAGTVLHLPVAPDQKGVSLTISGNNYNNLTITMNGETAVEVGKEVLLPQISENSYISLEFSSADGSGSCYLSAISLDYLSDDTAVEHTVTVGVGVQYDYSSIQAALEANESSASAPLVLLIAPGVYREQVKVDKPWVSFQPLYQDGGEIRIEAGYYSSNTFNEEGEFVSQGPYDVGTDQSGTVLVGSNATGFSAVGITFVNTYNLTEHTLPGEQTPAVAFSSAADKVYLSQCRFLGRQDTLYLHGSGSRVMVENCYIEGTVDFVFGDANAVFMDCDLFMAYYPGKNNGYFTAPNTKKGNTGLVFYSCNLTADARYSDGGTVSLGRPWQTEIYTETERRQDGSSYLVAYDPQQKNAAYANTSSASTFVACTMPSSLMESRWSIWTRKDAKGETVDVTYHADVRFAEVNSTNPDGSLVSVDESKLVLGTAVTVEDGAAYMADLMNAMAIGEAAGQWNPQVTIHSVPMPVQPEETPSQPEQPEQPVEPGEGDGAATDTGNPEQPVEPGEGNGAATDTGNPESTSPVQEAPVNTTVNVTGNLSAAAEVPAQESSTMTGEQQSADENAESQEQNKQPETEDVSIADEESPLAQSVAQEIEKKASAGILLPLAIVCVIVAVLLLILPAKLRKTKRDEKRG